LTEKIDPFCADLLANFETICEHIVEKFENKDAKRAILSVEWSFERGLIDLYQYYLGDNRDFFNTITFSLPFFFV